MNDAIVGQRPPTPPHRRYRFLTPRRIVSFISLLLLAFRLRRRLRLARNVYRYRRQLRLALSLLLFLRRLRKG
jgi:hypothetical protein